jgi:hypothetical protein
MSGASEGQARSGDSESRWIERCVDACRYCGQRQHLRRTVRIALVVGVILTAINQLDVILSGTATAFTWVKCALNFVVPFVVSNVGLLSGREPDTPAP